MLLGLFCYTAYFSQIFSFRIVRRKGGDWKWHWFAYKIICILEWWQLQEPAGANLDSTCKRRRNTKEGFFRGHKTRRRRKCFKSSQENCEFTLATFDLTSPNNFLIFGSDIWNELLIMKNPTQSICGEKYYKVEYPNTIQSVQWTSNNIHLFFSNMIAKSMYVHSVMTQKLYIHISTNPPLFSQIQKELDLICTFFRNVWGNIGFY